MRVSAANISGRRVWMAWSVKLISKGGDLELDSSLRM